MSATVDPIAVVGAGWSGLACAVTLVERGHPVHLLEAAPQPGGRARRAVLDGETLDNGQHLLLGAYRATRSLLARVGVSEASVLQRRPFAVALTDDAHHFSLRRMRAPGALGLLGGLVRAEGLTASERLRALASAPLLARPPRRGADAESWLAASGQPETLRRCLWRPLCLAALNLPTERACARVFRRVLGEAFARGDGCDLLLPRTDLGSILPEPAVQWLRHQGTPVSLGRRVTAVEADGAHWCVRTRAGDLGAGDVVLAGDPAATARLLPADTVSQRHAAQLRSLGQEPITTVYLHYPSHLHLPEPMLGRLDGPAQWLFDRALTDNPGVVAGVISGRGAHEQQARATVAAAVSRQVAAVRPDWPAPRRAAVVREKRATFACTPGSDERRLPVHGPRPGLWHAGDHVATGLPATLEGAVRAGQDCAHTLAQQREISS
jgi:squalene-associated FAD-dependent desaturase